MDESENLVEYLGIREGYDLLGHSWGGMLAAQYAATFRSKGLKHLILADSLARMGDWVEGSMRLLDEPGFRFPRQCRNVIKFAEKHPGVEDSMFPEEYEKLKTDGVDLESEEYRAALSVFMKMFVLRIDPWPESWNRALGGAEASPVGPIM